MKREKNPNPKRCTATSTTTGNQCAKWAIQGGTVCERHGGGSPIVRAAAQRRLLATKAQAATAKWQLPPIDNPLQALAELAGEIKGWSDHIRTKLDDYEGRYALHGYDADGKEYEQLRALVDLYTRLLDQQRKVLDTFGRQKIDERLAAIREGQKALIVQVFVAVFEEIGLEGEAMDRARRVAHDRLRSLPEAS